MIKPTTFGNLELAKDGPLEIGGGLVFVELLWHLHPTIYHSSWLSLWTSPGT